MSYPSRFFVDKSDENFYELLAAEKMFKDRNKKDLFMFAFTFGVANEIKPPVKKRSEFFHIGDLQEKDWAIIRSAILSLEPEGTLNNGNEVVTLAEQYAHGGIQIVGSKLLKEAFGSFENRLENLLRK